ncbi:MAG: hypothetical protein ISEC1_P1414 [Thiomicrorhabdus sp.]|nr:MAG: hypothetical protein ISEC1_P1414 [Thiomicrorhabdus sp.]
MNSRYFRSLIQSLSLILGLGLGSPALASNADEKIKQFVNNYFPAVGQHQSKPKQLWLTGHLKQQVKQILGHLYYKIRVPYWLVESSTPHTSPRSIWVLNETGKEKPITVGIVIQDNKIQSLRILKFRESRGWEVKLPSFTQQFDNIGFQQPFNINQPKLNQTIDGISGATLSVTAVTKLSKMALLLHQHITPRDH